jgi:hypothetical protein
MSGSEGTPVQAAVVDREGERLAVVAPGGLRLDVADHPVALHVLALAEELDVAQHAGGIDVQRIARRPQKVAQVPSGVLPAQRLEEIRAAVGELLERVVLDVPERARVDAVELAGAVDVGPKPGPGSAAAAASGRVGSPRRSARSPAPAAVCSSARSPARPGVPQSSCWAASQMARSMPATTAPATPPATTAATIAA